MSWQRHIMLLCIILACAVIQTTLTVLLWKGAQPDLLLATVVLFGLFLNPATGAVYAFGMGYLQDILTGGTVGIFMTDRVIIYILANRLSHQFYAKSAAAQFVLIALLTIADAIIVTVLSSIFGQGVVLSESQIWHIPVRAIVTALMGMPLYFLIKWLWEHIVGA